MCISRGMCNIFTSIFYRVSVCQSTVSLAAYYFKLIAAAVQPLSHEQNVPLGTFQWSFIGIMQHSDAPGMQL